MSSKTLAFSFNTSIKAILDQSIDNTYGTDDGEKYGYANAAKYHNFSPQFGQKLQSG
jgi:hypothetical protein